jgi:Mg-chelatase subunit ChlD
LHGALVAGESTLAGDTTLLDGLAERIESIPDEDFLSRAAALRDGFAASSPAARARLLEAVIDRHGGHARDLELAMGPERLERHHAADLVARRALAALGLEAVTATNGARVEPVTRAATTSTRSIAPLDRWRIVLGRGASRLPPTALRIAQSLDELYGPGPGEGSRRGGGSEPSFPTAREWADELELLFGTEVRDEVLCRAGASGRVGAVLELDAETVTPSIELLETVLSLKGALPEARLGRLRRLVERITRALVEELATRVRPALTGLATPRPTSRRGGPIDLRRTVARNLFTARRTSEGFALAPERFTFSTRARRSLDWRVIHVVDVSGSMEPSVIYSAMMASILGALPAIRTSFVAFSTEVLDLSERVDDPLGLLLEIRVGGGTDIAKALRYARTLVEVPARTILLVVSDLEEGGPLGALVAEVRALAESGVKILGLAALDDAGKPRFERAIAERLVEAGMPVAALSPLELARWIGEQVR